MECANLVFSGHALGRMFERSISPDDVRTAIGDGESIADYPDDRPYPSSLLLATVNGRALHVVVARDRATQLCIVVTVYEPDPARWSPDLRRRRT